MAKSKRELKKQQLKRDSQFAKALTDNTQTMKVQTSRISTVNKKMIQNYLEDPVGSYLDISKIMNVLYRTNGVVKANINYFSTIPTFNHSIYPTMNEKSKYEMSTMKREEYISAANFIDNLNIKQFAPYFIKETLINGYSLFYKIEDGKGIAYMEFPIAYGRIYSMEDGVFRWAVDIDKLDKIPEGLLPPEIENARSASRDDDNWIDKKYFKLSDKGIAFSFDLSVLSNGGVAPSNFSQLIASALRLEKARSNLELKDTIDSVKLVHSKIPTDKDGRPRMESSVAVKYDKAMKRAMPEGIVAITNPMDVTNVALNGSGDTKIYESSQRATDSLFYDTGTSDSMFGGKTTSSNIVKLSNLKDISWIYTDVLPFIESYYNYELTKFKSPSNMVWKINFIRQSYFTFSEDLKNAKEQLTLGGSRLDFLAASGMSPVEVINKLQLEQVVLDIDNIMIPKQTSHTMSGGANSGELGRPKADNPSDDTDRINDAT